MSFYKDTSFDGKNVILLPVNKMSQNETMNTENKKISLKRKQLK